MKSKAELTNKNSLKSSLGFLKYFSYALLIFFFGWGLWLWLSNPSEEVDNHLKIAIHNSSQLAEKISKNFGNKIRSRKAKVDDFVDEATGALRALGSVFDSDAEKRASMAKLFADEILNNKDLEDWADFALAEYKSGLNQIQNELAANLEGVLSENLALSLQPRLQASLDNDFHKLALGASDATLVREGSLVIGAIVIDQIIVAVLARTGTSAAIAGAGAANAYWTFGLSIVAAFGVDFLWDWLDESDERFAEKTRQTLDQQATVAEEEMQKILLRIANGTSKGWQEEIRMITFKTTFGINP